MPAARGKVAAALSGGVDSSVAALLLREQGFAVSGFHLRLVHNEDLGQGRESRCCSLSDAEDARLAAYHIGVPFYVFDLSEDFRATVVRRFAEALSAGETPNPCMDCNRFVKWGALGRRVRVLGFDTLATGHYARVRFDLPSGRWQLLRGRDAAKDQSYFLSRLTQEQLSRTLLPLGELTKAEVRERAADAGLVTAHKPDSQDLCFAPDGDYAAFWQRVTGKSLEPGNILDLKGTIIGKHRGLPRYTLGQHRGLGLPTEEPLYVCGKDTAANTLTVGPPAALYARGLTARECAWGALPALTAPTRVEVQTRYRQHPRPALALPAGENAFRVVFDQPERAVTPGQTVVLYDGELVLAAGTIDRPEA
jgi:tRNA-specific 2-thiouridylase